MSDKIKLGRFDSVPAKCKRGNRLEYREHVFSLYSQLVVHDIFLSLFLQNYSGRF